MAFDSQLRRLLRSASAKSKSRLQTETKLRQSTELFCAATTLCTQTNRFIGLFSWIWQQPSDDAFKSTLISWLDLLDHDHDLRSRLQHTWKAMLGSLDFVPFFAETGLPAQRALLPEIMERLFQRVLPPPRE